AAIAQTRDFLRVMQQTVGEVHAAGGALKEAFDAAHRALAPRYGRWPIFEHCLPFNVQRLWDELSGIDWPRIWTTERDREVWEELQRCPARRASPRIRWSWSAPGRSASPPRSCSPGGAYPCSWWTSAPPAS